MLIRLFWAFFKVGALAIGGSYTFYPLLEREIVKNYGWLSMEEFINVAGVSQAAPGPISIKYAVYVGYEVAGITGIIVASLGIMLPAVILMMLVVKGFSRYQNHPGFDGFLRGVRLATLGLILFFAWEMSTALTPELKGIFLAAAAFLGLLAFNLPPGFVLIFGGILGLTIF